MIFNELILDRQSVRRYAATRVEPEMITKFLEAAHLASSASKTQPLSFVVIDPDPLRTEVAIGIYRKR